MKVSSIKLRCIGNSYFIIFYDRLGEIDYPLMWKTVFHGDRFCIHMIIYQEAIEARAWNAILYS